MATLTLTALYRHITGDDATHQTTIAARFKRLDKRRQRIVRERLAGRSLHAIATEFGVKHGTIQDAIERAMQKIRKDLSGESRYNRAGRTPYGPRAARAA
jgi:DNA-directed RNA polymerase specialized sigma24 family protein